jgi:hypothetical protein
MGKSTPRVRLKRKRRKRYLARKAARLAEHLSTRVVKTVPAESLETLGVKELRAWIKAHDVPSTGAERRTKAGLRAAIKRFVEARRVNRSSSTQS